MDIRERMKNGKLYFCTDESVAREQLQCLDKLYDFNQTRPSEMEKRQKLLKELLAEVGENCYVEPPLHANWAKNTHFGSNVYANFNLTLVDDTDIYVGDSVMFGPNVTLATAGHPIDPDLRRKVAQTMPSRSTRRMTPGRSSNGSKLPRHASATTSSAYCASAGMNNPFASFTIRRKRSGMTMLRIRPVSLSTAYTPI